MQHFYNVVSSSISLPFIRRPQQDDTTQHRTLNYDVWYRVASYLSVDDARNLSMVSRECHAASLRKSMSLVKPKDEGSFQTLCMSMSTGVHYPASSLQELRIGRKALGAPSFSFIWVLHRFSETSPIPDALAFLLEQAVNLRALSLQCVEDLVTMNARVGDALARLEHLDTLELLDIGPETLAVTVSRMESRPTSLTLSYESRSSSPSDLFRLARLPLLERARKLSLYRFQFGDTPVNTDLPGADTLHPWPELRELRLSYCAYLPFHRLFPNMHTLSMWRVWMMGSADMRFVRWPSTSPLQHVIADQHNIRCLLGTPVRWLDIKTYFVDGEATARAVRETTPVALSLWCPSYETLNEEFWDGLVAATQVPRARLRYLILTLQGRQEDGLRWLHEIMPRLSATRLLCIRLVIVDVYSPSDGEPTSTERHGNPDRVPFHWQAFFRAAQGALARAIPSLRFISMLFVPKPDEDLPIQYGEDFDGDFSWWRVLGHSGDAGLCDSMSGEVGEKIHRHLLSKEFEQALDLDDETFM
ncbi:hypothetical protein DAEQUDRAFT_768125 [Daedalea quercina L-15889]|uniref:F-box domain-containing protein n=1 Tax=Daedalea quercina L-15889 TaxID=1314783 RepID=A0A165MZ55_9APHY|nr:hypothetical protein DAEQUDRAFT_768125 [Daedalea quercina L-15889]